MTNPFDDQDRLIQALKHQEIVNHDETVARKLAEVSELIECKQEKCIFEQSDLCNDIYFILAGEVAIHVNGRFLRKRFHGQQFGEMAIVNPGGSRSARVLADCGTHLAKVKGHDFVNIAKDYPALWQGIAKSLAVRLHQRNERERQKNAKPRVFIGSSSESKPALESIAATLRDPNIDVVPWVEIFNPSKYPMEDLEQEALHSDFAILILAPDDKVRSRSWWRWRGAPRDNVIFETGLFMGGLGRKRVFMFCAHNQLKKLKLPSDIISMGLVPYSSQEDLEKKVGDLKRRILEEGAK